jgi:hypothetical protein
MQAGGGTIRIAHPRANVQRVLDLTGLGAVLSPDVPALV